MSQQRFHVDLYTPSYKQYDDGNNWYNEKTSCGGTMASEGCFITSVAMVFRGFDHSGDPGTLLAKLKAKKADCPFQWSTAASEYSHTWHGKTSGAFSTLKQQIFNKIVNDLIPVLVHVPNHLVVVKGFSGTLSTNANGSLAYNEITPSMFMVNDPGSSTNSTLQDVINQRGAVDYFAHYTA
ncbi:hypothetical protein DUZ99_10595 [Xylanibacillus composti]|uniref:Peptidase C39-like domain-containing protein n=1 Tax=Xylanibacillus composti TaxID=1572762 RepID=A0A8J4H7Z2_9BACL|nr:hypothetical protein [Xylanibacillus composti]MDT9725418.1 hypothetical protein [Xylanibacillus composti]GIQ71547.1 hypothetical protein XYCOK13_43710 [Xylanibacillus composti]